MLMIPPTGALPGPSQSTGTIASNAAARPTQKAQTETGPPPYEPPAAPVSIDSADLAVTEPRATVFELSFGGGTSGHAESLTVASALAQADDSRRADQSSHNRMAEKVETPAEGAGDVEAAERADEARGRAAEQAYAASQAAAAIEVPPILSKAV